MTTIDFSDESQDLLNDLKGKFRVSSNKRVIEKCLMIAAVVSDELDSKGCVTIIQKDGTQLKILIPG